MNQPSLFDQPRTVTVRIESVEDFATGDVRLMNTRGMVHTNDPPTSTAAAKRINQCKSDLHQRVISAFSRLGPMTDGELEALPEFSGYGPSTLRKRRSELFKLGKLVASGDTRQNARGSAMVVWKLSTK